MNSLRLFALVIAGIAISFSCKKQKSSATGWNYNDISASTGFEVIKPYNYVNPFIGTGGHGHTYPGATAPFGMVQLSPDT
ncbi:MAG: hypothetical protein ACKVOR_08565, partial [Flavobacteriales bacterium]